MTNALDRLSVHRPPKRDEPCRHSTGDWIAEKGFFLCITCWERLDTWPRLYGEPKRKSMYDGPPQVIVWEAQKAVTTEGISLNDFISCMARRYRQKTRPRMDLSDAYDAAIDYLKCFPDRFGHPDYDWSKDAAREMADDDMSYWDDASGGNQ